MRVRVSFTPVTFLVMGPSMSLEKVPAPTKQPINSPKPPRRRTVAMLSLLARVSIPIILPIAHTMMWTSMYFLEQSRRWVSVALAECRA